MKKRIEKIVIAILLLLGLTASFALIKHYFPAWAYWSCWGAITTYVLYLVSKPETHYWMYVIKYDDRYVKGVIKTFYDKFSLPEEHINRINEINSMSVFEIEKRRLT